MDPAHPLGVAAGQVVVDGDEVHALAADAVEVGGQRGHEGLALTGLHLGDPAEVEGGPAHHLDVVVTLTDDPVGGFAGDGERLDEQIVERGAVVELLSELGGLALQLLVRQTLHVVGQCVDVGDDALQRLEFLAFSRAEDAIEDAHATAQPTGVGVAGGFEPGGA